MPSWRERKAALLDESGKLHSKAVSGELSDADFKRIDALEGELKEASNAIEAADAAQARMKVLSGESPESKATRDPLSETFVRQVGAQGLPGAKSVFSGSGSVALALDPVGAIVGSPFGRQGVANLVAQAQLGESDQYSYLRQSSRTNNAAAVPIGETKPTSVYELERVTGQVVTLAHLSEPIAKQWLADIGNLQDFISAEMTSGLQVALGGFLLHGSSEPEVSGILNTTGVRDQAYGDDLLATCRSAVTTLQENGEQPSAWAFNPRDWQRIEQVRDDQNRYLYGGMPQGRPGQQLFGLPAEIDVNLDEGTGLLADWSTVRVLARQPVTVDWSESGSLFEKNEVRFRCEARVGLALIRPPAVSTVQLVSSGS
jgi:HK97 family phage major capsid protein